MTPKQEPLIDIIMLVHNQAKWADLSIRAVEHFTANPYRLILVDNASTNPDTVAVVARAREEGHTVIRLEESRGYSHAVNVGVSAGSSRFVVVMGDDGVVTEGWDAAMVQDMSTKHIGLVGARSNYASGAQSDPAFVGEPPYLVFVCVGLRREVWDAVGPMDEVTFDGFSSEDVDYSWRVRKAGYKLKVSNAFILHAGSRSITATYGGTDGLAKANAKYNARLVDKWGRDWARVNSTTQKRVLVVTYHAEDWCFVRFMEAMISLKRSDGVAFTCSHVTRHHIAQARTGVADKALELGFDYILQLDGDAQFPPDLIRRFMEDLEGGPKGLGPRRDIVCALAYQRKPPHLTCAFEMAPGGLLGAPLEGIEHTGLRRVDVSGFHCSMIRTSVIQRMRDGLKGELGADVVAGTRTYYGGFDNKLGEDFAFCINAKKVGVEVYVDTDLISGHIGDAVVIDEAYKRAFLAQRGPA